MASSMAKPNGIFEVTPGTEWSNFWPLPVQSLLGIGEKPVQPLNAEGIQTIGDLQKKIPMEEPIDAMGLSRMPISRSPL